MEFMLEGGMIYQLLLIIHIEDSLMLRRARRRIRRRVRWRIKTSF